MTPLHLAIKEANGDVDKLYALMIDYGRQCAKEAA